MLSIICPTYNEEKYITSCIDSILCQDYPHEDMEVLFVDGMSKDRTREIIQEYSTRYPFVRLLNNPQRIVPYAMNMGIESAKGEIVIRIDAHAFYAPNYFLILVDYLQRLDADNVGAICKTDVLNKTPKTLAIREILSNRFGVGNSLFRVGVNRVTEVDTVPFGCYRKSVFERWGKYDTRLVRNQDIELNKRIKRGGGKIFIVPDTYCTYLARESFQSVMKNNYSNGKWNILTVYYTGQFDSLSMRHFIPLFFVLSLLVPPLLALLYFSFVYLMEKSTIVLTDSGGIQEEAPGLGKPVLVMRDTTERPEALEAGTVKLVGTNYDKIVSEVSSLLDNQLYYDKMSQAVNPYGDGKACERIVLCLKS